MAERDFLTYEFRAWAGQQRDVLCDHVWGLEDGRHACVICGEPLGHDSDLPDGIDAECRLADALDHEFG